MFSYLCRSHFPKQLTLIKFNNLSWRMISTGMQFDTISRRKDRTVFCGFRWLLPLGELVNDFSSSRYSPATNSAAELSFWDFHKGCPPHAQYSCMAQQDGQKGKAAKPNSVSVSPGTHVVEDKINSFKQSSDLHTHTKYKYKIFKCLRK